MTTRIESTAIVEPGAVIGVGCYIGHYAVIRPGVVVGDRSHVRAHCFIAEGATIGKDTQIMQFSNICRGCIVEDEVFVGMGCMTTNTKKIAYRRPYKDIAEPPIIRRAARIGARVTILPGVEIGENAVVGAGSLVHKDLAGGYIFVGTPVVLLKKVPDEEMI
jgi:acetyltransferase-like isoleucine patch superfamily enzyme